MSDPNENGPRVQPRPVVFSQKNQPSNAGKSNPPDGDQQGGEAVSDNITLHKSDCALLLGGYQCTCGLYQRNSKTLPALAAEQPVAKAWAEGYQQGVKDERTSEASIGIAGFGAKVEPARQNPYGTALAAEPTKPEPVAWLYKGEPWFDGDRWHDNHQVTTSKQVAKFKDKNAQPLYTAPPDAPTVKESLTHPGYIIGSHWLETAYSRICAGEAEADVLRDCGWERVDEALRRDAERYKLVLNWLWRYGLLSREKTRINTPESYGDWWILRKPKVIDGSSLLGYGKTEDAAIDSAMGDKT